MSVKHSMLAVLVMLLWGVNIVVIDMGLGDVPPLLFLALRFTFVAVPLVFFVPRPKASWRAVVAIGTFMSLGQFSLLYVALDLGLPTGLAALLLQTQVIFTIVFGAIVIKEPPSRRQAVGAAIGTSGLALVVVAHGFSAPLLPVLVMLGATLSWATGNVIVRHAGVRSGFSLVVWSALLVPVPALLLSVVVDGGPEVGHTLANLSATAIASAAYTTIGGSIIGYGIWNSLLARYPAGFVTPYVLLVPVIGIATAWVVQDEVPTALELAGGAIMLAGVSAAVTSRRIEDRPTRRRHTEAASHSTMADDGAAGAPV